MAKKPQFQDKIVKRDFTLFAPRLYDLPCKGGLPVNIPRDFVYRGLEFASLCPKNAAIIPVYTLI